MRECRAYAGLNVHKDTIAVAVTMPGPEEPVYRGEIENQRQALLRLVRSLSPHGEVLSFCYEAGPCGFGVYREIIDTGHHCEVVAPNLILRRVGERVKTDRRDAVKLARLHRSGELRAVWVPDEEQEAMRDLTRAREDMKAIELKARQRLHAFLLRHGRVYREGKSRRTHRHFRWLEEQRFEHPAQQIVFQEYIDTVMEARRRVAGLEGQMREALAGWSLRPVVEALIALVARTLPALERGLPGDPRPPHPGARGDGRGQDGLGDRAGARAPRARAAALPRHCHLRAERDGGPPLAPRRRPRARALPQRDREGRAPHRLVRPERAAPDPGAEFFDREGTDFLLCVLALVLWLTRPEAAAPEVWMAEDRQAQRWLRPLGRGVSGLRRSGNSFRTRTVDACR